MRWDIATTYGDRNDPDHTAFIPKRGKRRYVRQFRPVSHKAELVELNLRCPARPLIYSTIICSARAVIDRLGQLIVRWTALQRPSCIS